MKHYRNLIAQQLATLRQSKGLSQSELAAQLRACGCPFEYMDIVLLETDRASITDLELQQLKNFFGTTYDYLIEGKQD